MTTNNVENNNTSEATPPDLVDVVTKILIKHNHPNPEAWTSRLNPDAFNPRTLDIQRFLINRAWHQILGELDINKIEDTLDIRYQLVDTGEIKRWVELFEQGVVPCIIRHNLPLTPQ
jgi:hypothetical protein